MGAYQRSVHGILLKLSYLLGGVNSSQYFLIRAFFFSLNTILVYLFMKKITNNNPISIISAFFYASLPFVYAGVSWIGASEVFSQFFLMLALHIFLYLYNSDKHFKYFGLFLVILTGILSIKSREDGIILIPILAFFLIFKLKEWKTNKTWWIVIVVLLMYILPTFFLR